MKKVVSIVMFLAISGFGIINAQKIVCKIKGSDTCLPLIQKEAETYQNKNAGSSIMVTGGGSGVGFAAIFAGTTDIAMASRGMKTDEKIKMNELGKPFKEVVIAKDELTVIVNPANKVSQLTREQLESIFTGKVTNWKEVGGDDMEIVIYSRESSSGTYVFFKDHVLKEKNFSPKALQLPATGAIVQSVSQTKGAIGYIGFTYIDKTIKTLKLSFNKGKTYVEPCVENAKNKTYPLIRPLYFYYLKASEAKIASFVNFALSAEGQAIVSKEGYIPLQ